MKDTVLIGKKVIYQAQGRTFQGTVVDKSRVLGKGEDEGSSFDLVLVAMPGGRIYKISPAAIKQIIEEE